MPAGLVADPSFGSSSGALIAQQAQNQATKLGCSQGAAEAYADPQFIPSDGTSVAAAHYQFVISSVLLCPGISSSLLMQRVLSSLNSQGPAYETTKTISGLGQDAVLGESPHARPQPAYAVIWAGSPYLLELGCAGPASWCTASWVTLAAHRI